MGQKVNPNGFRVGVIRDWNTRWYANKKEFSNYLIEDDKIRKHLKKASTAKNGDILTRTNHVMVFLELRGKKRVANAHFLDHGGTYGIIEKVGQHTDIWRPDCPSYFSYGDEFTDMKYLKRFLNWYGGYGLRGYTFGDKTREAVKDFQTKEGLTVDGKFGAESLARAKAVTK